MVAVQLSKKHGPKQLGRNTWHDPSCLSTPRYKRTAHTCMGGSDSCSAPSYRRLTGRESEKGPVHRPTPTHHGTLVRVLPISKLSQHQHKYHTWDQCELTKQAQGPHGATQRHMLFLCGSQACTCHPQQCINRQLVRFLARCRPPAHNCLDPGQQAQQPAKGRELKPLLQSDVRALNCTPTGVLCHHLQRNDKAAQRQTAAPKTPCFKCVGCF